MSEPIPDPDFPPEEPIPPEYPDPDPGPEQPVVDGWTDAPVSGDRVNVFDAPIVAGDPDGARIEIRSTGFHAFNGVGTETAHIDGAEGVFVGGEFRTSDTLPGQVTLSDSAAQGKPGLSVEPEDATGYDTLPSIGPDATSMHIRGGVAVDGSLAGASFDPTGSSIYHNGPGETGTGSWALVNGSEARLAYRDDRTNAAYESGMWVRPSSAQLYREDAQGVGYAIADIGHVGLDYYPSGGSSGAHSRIRASATDVIVSRRDLAGARRALRVDDTGVWVDLNTGPFTDTLVSHNLLETAQDSGWQSITLASGISGSWSPAWRNKGGVIYLRGRVTKTGNWTAGWNVLASDVGPDARPASHIQRAGATRGVGGTFLEVTTGGVLQVWFENDTPGTTTVEMSPMFYPLG